MKFTAAVAMVAEIRGVFGTLTYPNNLIQPYSAYYGHLASHYGVLGAPLYPAGAIICIYKYLSRLYIEKWSV